MAAPLKKDEILKQLVAAIEGATIGENRKSYF
jgi:hypothetical protein